WHAGKITWDLQRFVEGQDGLRGDRSAQRGDVAGARSALEPVDARPFADVIAVGRPGLEQVLLQPRHDRAFRVILLAVRIRRGEGDIETGGFEQPLLDPDDDRQVEHRIVRGDPDDRFFLDGWHTVLHVGVGYGRDAERVKRDGGSAVPQGAQFGGGDPAIPG